MPYNTSPHRRNLLSKLLILTVSIALIYILTTSFNQIPFHVPPPELALNSAPVQAGSFLHLTDIHIDDKYVVGSSPESYCHSKSSSLKGGAGKYGVLGGDCDSPLQLVDDTYLFIANELSPKLSFIIDTGDAVRHNRDKTRPKFSDEGLADHERVVRYYQRNLDLDKIKVIPTIGNNDEFAHDTTSPHSPLLKNLVDIWAPYNLGLKHNSGFLKGGYFNVTLLQGKLRVISLNTLAWYKKNPKLQDCHKKGLGLDQMNWLESQLKLARKEDARVYIIGHIPPHKKTGKRAYSKSCYKDYLNLSGDFNDVILGHFHGHTNVDNLSVLLKKSLRKTHKGKHLHKYKLVTLAKDSPPSTRIHSQDIVAVLTNGPSIIPVHNPSLRVYSFDHHQKGALLGYTQYYADLKEANKQNKLTYRVEYTSWSAYGLIDLSLTSWREFIPRLVSSSSKLYTVYSRFFTVSGPTS